MAMHNKPTNNCFFVVLASSTPILLCTLLHHFVNHTKMPDNEILASIWSVFSSLLYWSWDVDTLVEWPVSPRPSQYHPPAWANQHYTCHHWSVRSPQDSWSATTTRNTTPKVFFCFVDIGVLFHHFPTTPYLNAIITSQHTTVILIRNMLEKAFWQHESQISVEGANCDWPPLASLPLAFHLQPRPPHHIQHLQTPITLTSHHLPLFYNTVSSSFCNMKSPHNNNTQQYQTNNNHFTYIAHYEGHCS